jgi:hypothetical protein
MGLPLAVSGN